MERNWLYVATLSISFTIGCGGDTNKTYIINCAGSASNETSTDHAGGSAGSSGATQDIAGGSAGEGGESTVSEAGGEAGNSGESNEGGSVDVGGETGVGGLIGRGGATVEEIGGDSGVAGRESDGGSGGEEISEGGNVATGGISEIAGETGVGGIMNEGGTTSSGEGGVTENGGAIGIGGAIEEGGETGIGGSATGGTTGVGGNTSELIVCPTSVPASLCGDSWAICENVLPLDLVPKQTLIKEVLMPTIYWYSEDGKRYVIPNEETYETWFTSGDDCPTIYQIDPSELYPIPIGGNVTYRPISQMIKITTDPKVYIVTCGAILRRVETEAVMAELYGDDWASYIVDVPDAFFVDYSIGEPILSADDIDLDAEFNRVTTIDDDLACRASI